MGDLATTWGCIRSKQASDQFMQSLGGAFAGVSLFSLAAMVMVMKRLENKRYKPKMTRKKKIKELAKKNQLLWKNKDKANKILGAPKNHTPVLAQKRSHRLGGELLRVPSKKSASSGGANSFNSRRREVRVAHFNYQL